MKFNFPACPLPAGASVWCYLRDSGGDTQDLASQRAYVLAYCEHYHLHLARLFEDGAISGGSVAGRDEFTLMIEMSRLSDAPAVSGIVYWDTKRFARNQLDSQFYKADLRRRGYTLISISDDIPDNEFAIVFESFLEWKAQKDREDISKDSRRGLAFIVGLKDADGQYVGVFPGKPPTCFTAERYDTGLKRNNGQPRIVQRIVPDLSTWERGVLAWQRRAERASYTEIEQACRLFPNAIKPDGSYNTFFANEIYIGRLHYGGQVYENFVKAMATPEQWEAVRSLAHQRPRKGQSFPAGKIHPKAGRAARYLLSGLCECEYCQAAMHGSVNTRKDRDQFWRFYICARKQANSKGCVSKSVSAQRLEEATLEVINSRVLTIDFVGELMEQVNRLLSDTGQIEGKLTDAERQLKSLDRAIKNLLDLAEVHPSADVLGRLREREGERNKKRSELTMLQNQISRQSVRVDERLIVSILADMKLSLNGAEMKARQHVLRHVVEKIIVGRNSARLHYKFPLKQLHWDWYMPLTGYELTPIQYAY